ncbi:hypothetical protein EJI00_17040 [Variovorax sp. DXTD-1]|nr:hypothetical protein EJI00_17040 [Variovorax sp. DXTD-1]
MSIGVLNFHRCINYGSYWQARLLADCRPCLRPPEERAPGREFCLPDGRENAGRRLRQRR